MQSERLFAWVSEPYTRRSALRQVHTAVRRGWLDGPGQAGRREALIAALTALAADPAARPAEVVRVGRIFAAMRAQNQNQE